MDHIGHMIDGCEVPSVSGETFPSIDPSTGLEIARIAFGTVQDVDLAVTLDRLLRQRLVCPHRQRDADPQNSQRILNPIHDHLVSRLDGRQQEPSAAAWVPSQHSKREQACADIS